MLENAQVGQVDGAVAKGAGEFRKRIILSRQDSNCSSNDLTKGVGEKYRLKSALSSQRSSEQRHQNSSGQMDLQTTYHYDTLFKPQ